ncbi:hypothetical protein [Sphingobacterium lactis]|uniref:hypothetical protein n=1 Tax=Sphingobacterium lactis TaxID=797291 RepID=UPI003DA61779
MKNLFYILTGLFLSACASLPRLTSAKMDRLELGMTKEQVTHILGSGYTIAEKREDNNIKIEVLSYRDFYKDDEFYLFKFLDGKLEKWYRELTPKIEK